MKLQSDQIPKTINTKAGLLEYVEFGKGPVILSIHGAMGGYDQSEILARTIGPEGFRYIAVSRPGYLGTPIKSGKTPKEQAELYVELIDQLKIDKIGIFAISGGGPSAIYFAINNPDRCWGLVLASTLSGKMTEKVPFSFKIFQLMTKIDFIAKKLKKMTINDFNKAALRSIPDDTLRAKTLENPKAGPLFKWLLASTMDQISRRLKGTGFDIKYSRTTEFNLEEIKVPTLVIHGTNDSIVGYESHGKVLAKRIPNAELCIIENGEHVSIFTHCQQISEKVCGFVKPLA